MAYRKHHDIWSGPIIGYGDVSGFCAGGQFKRPGNFNYALKPKDADKGGPTKKSAPPNTGADGQRKQPAKGAKKKSKSGQPDKALRAKLRETQEKLAHAERDKEKRARAAERLRYLQTCLMRLTLSLTAYIGEADGFLDQVAAYGFDEEYVVTREPGLVTAKSVESKHLSLRAGFADDTLTLGLYGGRSYMVHGVIARCSDSYLGKTWHVEDLW